MVPTGSRRQAFWPLRVLTSGLLDISSLRSDLGQEYATRGQRALAGSHPAFSGFGDRVWDLGFTKEDSGSIARAGTCICDGFARCQHCDPAPWPGAAGGNLAGKALCALSAFLGGSTLYRLSCSYSPASLHELILWGFPER